MKFILFPIFLFVMSAGTSKVSFKNLGTARVDSIGDISVQLGLIKSDTATIQEVLLNKGLKVSFRDTNYHPPIVVRSFYTTFMGSSGDTVRAKVPSGSNMISEEQASIIKTLRHNSKIILHDIVVINPNCIPRSIGPFYITIK